MSLISLLLYRYSSTVPCAKPMGPIMRSGIQIIWGFGKRDRAHVTHNTKPPAQLGRHTLEQMPQPPFLQRVTAHSAGLAKIVGRLMHFRGCWAIMWISMRNLIKQERGFWVYWVSEMCMRVCGPVLRFSSSAAFLGFVTHVWLPMPPAWCPVVLAGQDLCVPHMDLRALPCQ